MAEQNEAGLTVNYKPGDRVLYTFMKDVTRQDDDGEWIDEEEETEEVGVISHFYHDGKPSFVIGRRVVREGEIRRLVSDEEMAIRKATPYLEEAQRQVRCAIVSLADAADPGSDMLRDLNNIDDLLFAKLEVLKKACE